MNAFFNFSEVGTEISSLAELSKSFKMLPETELNQSVCLWRRPEDINREGFTDQVKREIKSRTGWSDEILGQLQSESEAKIYEQAGLEEKNINGKECLIRENLDLNRKDEMGCTNLQRMQQGRPPLDCEGKQIELHHIGQKENGGLAELSQEEHRGKGNDVILHNKTLSSEINRGQFKNERAEYWRERARLINEE